MQQLLMMESVLIFNFVACQHFRQVPGKSLKRTRFSHPARNLSETQSSTLIPATAKISIMLVSYVFILEIAFRHFERVENFKEFFS